MSKKILDLGKVLLTPAGEYDPDVQYERLDFVFYERASYVAKDSVKGVAPAENSEYWQKLSDTNDYTDLAKQYAQSATNSAAAAAQQVEIAKHEATIAKQQITEAINEKLDEAKAEVAGSLDDEIASAKQEVTDSVTPYLQEMLSHVNTAKGYSDNAEEQYLYAKSQADLAKDYVDNSIQDIIDTTNNEIERAKTEIVASFDDDVNEAKNQITLYTNTKKEEIIDLVDEARDYSVSANNYKESAKNYSNSALESKTSASNYADIVIQKAEDISNIVDGVEEAVSNTNIYMNTTKDYLDQSKDNLDSVIAYANDAKASKNSASASEEAARQSKVDAESYKNMAEESAEIAAECESNARDSATRAKTSENNAKSSENSALESKNKANESQTKSKISEDNAKDSEVAAATSESNARTYMLNAKDSETASATSASNALTSENNALLSKNSAKSSEDAAAQSASKALTSELHAKDSEDNALDSANSASESSDNAYSYLLETQNAIEVFLNTLHSDLALQNVSNATATSKNNKVELMWTDPEDIIYEDVFESIWSGTKVVRKTGSVPTNYTDGTLIIDSKIRNQYSTSYYLDEDLDYEQTYYYRFFPYNTNGVHTNGTSVNAYIGVPVIEVLPSQDEEIVYDGEQHIAHFKNFDNSLLIVSGNTGTDAGVYTAIFTPKQGCKWFDDTTEPKTVTWIINRQKIDYTPSQSGTLIYNGNILYPTWANYNAKYFDIDGDTEGINAGSYTATFLLKNNYCLSNGSISPVSVSWFIDKANGSVTCSDDSIVVLDNTTIQKTITLSNATGNISVVSSDTDIVNVSYSSVSNQLKIINAMNKSGDATITITVAESDNYYEYSKIINVKNNYAKPVHWYEGTDEDICNMVDAALSGQISLSDYWSVGEERQIEIDSIYFDVLNESQSSQMITLVLAHDGLYEYAETTTTNTSGEVVTPKNKDKTNRDKVSFVVVMKNNFATVGSMNDTNTNSGSWRDCTRRLWCNNDLYNAIPATLRPIFAQFKTKTIDVYNGTELQTTKDYFAIAAAKEVMGTESYSNATESAALTQFDYYAMSNYNKIRLNGGNNSGQTTGSVTYTRSPYKSSATYYVTIDANGNTNRSNPTNQLGISVFGCIK